MLTLADCTAIIEKEIKNYPFPETPEELYDPVKYILDLGGKRLRPALTLLSANLFSDNYLQALPSALAVEIFHNFTLLHDDIMDKADIRRGKATVHKVWDENTAILSGDAAMILAYQSLTNLSSEAFADSFKLFNNTALEVCEGQQYDMNFEQEDDVLLDEYLGMIRLKTSVLLAASMQLGGIAVGVNKEIQYGLYELGENLGLAFQLQDDYLDAFSDASKFGKATGGDIINNKKTYLLIKALNSDNATAVAELKNWIAKTEFNPQEKINAVLEIYTELGIAHDAQMASINFINQSVEILNQIEAPAENKKPLEDIIFKLMYREK